MPACLKPDYLPSIKKTITHSQIRLYASASGDQNPIHLDETFASNSHLGQIVAHGMLTLAFLSEMLTVAYGQSWIESGNMKVKFRRPAFPGEQLCTWGKVDSDENQGNCRLIRCSIALLTCENSEEVIAGTATVSLPRNQEPV